MTRPPKWGDDLALLLLAGPLTMAFLPPCQEAARAGAAILATFPEWYQAAVGIALGAVFGSRNLGGLVGRLFTRQK